MDTYETTKRAITQIALLVGTAMCCMAQASLPSTNFLALDHQHTDGLTIMYEPASSNVLSLFAWQRDAGLDLPTNQVIFVVKTQAMLTLPAGTPFGDAGSPIWILPQSQNPELLYLGVNAERVPSGVFTGPLTIQLKQMVGPGYFMAWQALGPGQYNIRINTRDGIDTNDSFMPMIGAHEHFNWGFSTPGVYCATFQVIGQRLGESTNIFSQESTFLFQVLPMPPATNYASWAKHYWPPSFNPPITLTNGNADEDIFNNLLEYAFNLSPTNADGVTAAPFFSFVTTNSQRYGAFTFPRYLPGQDLDYVVEGSSALPGPWLPLTNVFSALTNGVTELRTMLDATPATSGQRFYRLKVNLH
jgi:surface-anchored protein